MTKILTEGRHFTMHDDEDAGDKKTTRDDVSKKRTWPTANDPLAPGGKIGTRLRALYDQIEQEPVPDMLLDLLEKLDEAERQQNK